jgi:hypothetical protein
MLILNNYNYYLYYYHQDTYNDMYKKAQHVYNESMEESSKIPTKKSHKTKTIKRFVVW